MIANKKVNVAPLMTILSFDQVKEYADKMVAGEDFIKLVVRTSG